VFDMVWRRMIGWDLENCVETWVRCAFWKHKYANFENNSEQSCTNYVCRIMLNLEKKLLGGFLNGSLFARDWREGKQLTRCCREGFNERCCRKTVDEPQSQQKICCRKNVDEDVDLDANNNTEYCKKNCCRKTVDEPQSREVKEKTKRYCWSGFITSVSAHGSLSLLSLSLVSKTWGDDAYEIIMKSALLL
jgi:hypothetical protein